MAKKIMILGTMSGVGKSFITAGLLRIFKEEGLKAAPFKSQNMALNSFVTKEGLEIGRAQAMQAEAAGAEIEAAMNPILLKPEGDMRSQVIIMGERHREMSASEYYEKKGAFIPVIKEAFLKLDREYDVIVLEGAGSPAEINLNRDDIVNIGMAKIASSPCLLIGDIDRGGVFAQLKGTLDLLRADERRYVKGTVINRFRGDMEIFKEGRRITEEITSLPVLGVVPYMDIRLDDEDSLSDSLMNRTPGELIDAAVIRFPRISNFTDLEPIRLIKGAGVRFVSSPEELGFPDILILPGTKNTLGDLRWLRKKGLDGAIRDYAKKGVVFGICGGFEMLGKSINDPSGIEEKGSEPGLALLDTETVITENKVRKQVSGKISGITGSLSKLNGLYYEGYEIHMGEMSGCEEIPPLIQKGDVYGTFIHGIFDRKEILETLINTLAERKGLNTEFRAFDRKKHKERQYTALAEGLRQNLDMEKIRSIMNEGAG